MGAVLTAKSVVAGGEGVVLEQRGWPFATKVAPTGLAGYLGCLEFFPTGWVPSPVGAVLTAKSVVAGVEELVLEQRGGLS